MKKNKQKKENGEESEFVLKSKIFFLGLFILTLLLTMMIFFSDKI